MQYHHAAWPLSDLASGALLFLINFLQFSHDVRRRGVEACLDLLTNFRRRHGRILDATLDDPLLEDRIGDHRIEGLREYGRSLLVGPLREIESLPNFEIHAQHIIDFLLDRACFKEIANVRHTVEYRIGIAWSQCDNGNNLFLREPCGPHTGEARTEIIASLGFTAFDRDIKRAAALVAIISASTWFPDTR